MRIFVNGSSTSWCVELSMFGDLIWKCKHRLG
uniref:Uncharacterized protein n=1 Tax=Rhizophora mucronata TaxID=61149 RepID=A0A2P2NAW1_RHIMU